MRQGCWCSICPRANKDANACTLSSTIPNGSMSRSLPVRCAMTNCSMTDCRSRRSHGACSTKRTRSAFRLVPRSSADAAARLSIIATCSNGSPKISVSTCAMRTGSSWSIAHSVPGSSPSTSDRHVVAIQRRADNFLYYICRIDTESRPRLVSPTKGHFPYGSHTSVPVRSAGYAGCISGRAGRCAGIVGDARHAHAWWMGSPLARWRVGAQDMRAHRTRTDSAAPPRQHLQPLRGRELGE